VISHLVSKRRLSEVMGHSDLGVTQRVYVHLCGREEAEEQYRQAMSD
jgi:integrase